MPWADPSLPSLGCGLLQAQLQKNGVPCDTLYANLIAVKALENGALYQAVLHRLEAELIYSGIYYGEKELAAEKLAKLLPLGSNSGNKWTTETYSSLLAKSEQALEVIVTGVEWRKYDIIGFSLMFQQTLSSLCLAKRIKELYPCKTIIFGGAACDHVMGPGILRSFSEVDFTYSGEADDFIAPLIRQIRVNREQESPQYTIPGLALRNARGEVEWLGQAAPTPSLNDLPYPDYSDYFEQLKTLRLDSFSPSLYIETSRGCWYGQKKTCRFCGVNGSSIKYRSKEPDRAVDEILELSRRHNTTLFRASDNVLDRGYFKTLLPKLAQLRHEQSYNLSFLFEIRSPLTQNEARLLRDAGVVVVQPGIESLSDNVLRLMRKGVSAIQHVQLLKFLAEMEIHAIWNILSMSPGEKPQDYDEMVALTEYISHLPIPGMNFTPIRLERFSPYFNDPEEFGISDVKPDPLYREIFPNNHVDIENLAYRFTFMHSGSRDEKLLASQKALVGALENWQANYTPWLLTYSQGPDFIRILDRRPNNGSSERIITLRGVQAKIFKFCNEAKPFTRITEQFSGDVGQEVVPQFLKNMVSLRLMYRSGADQYLSLPLRRKLVGV